MNVMETVEYDQTHDEAYGFDATNDIVARWMSDKSLLERRI